ncbi:aminoglycoside phosphotransferase (APT) family kinase protein [Maribacter caenipelagi]|uniref:Aminoglycoside phosphotransferase (APT) family kinase protein n=1 Tax=Maribacter caenipelagi TaxID=1447781 RepID=A0A4R7D048_9FLAO|nr:phosphotransferase family protein [Maribacter caenipelagi]TDS14293.1 aminoglycoside phosphotransferase (APT) family kinase protein [Maribacter caenipelagi]
MNLKPVRDGEELDELKLKKFLLEHNLITTAKSELKVHQFSNGFSNLTYLLHIEDKEFVLRRPPFAAPKRGHDMGREYKVIHNLNKLFDKAPTAFAYTEDVDVIGAPFYIMSKVSGEILTSKEARVRNVSPVEFKIVSNTWLDTFVEFHKVDYKAAGLENLGRPVGYVERQVTNWGKQYLAAATDNVPTAEKVMSWMQDNQPKKYDHTLIHNDFKYDNVVFKDDTWKEITAILDWEMCTLGDPLMDLGTSLGYWTTAADPDFMKQGLQSPTVMEGNPSRTEIVQQYALKSGRNIDNLTFYYAYGLFKIAVIAQQIYYRYKHGHTSDPKFAYLNKASELCCNTAWQAIQKNQIDNLF